MVRPTLRERISRKTKVDANGCWMWTGCVQARGYGSIGVGGRGRTMLTHRAAYTAWKGDIPEGMQIDHACHTADLTCPGGDSCRHRRCVNPDHLDVVTQEENRRRALPPTSPESLRPVCGRGHRLPDPRVRDCEVCAPIVAAILARFDEDLDFTWDDVDRMWAELDRPS